MGFYVDGDHKVLMCFRVLKKGYFNTLNFMIDHEQFERIKKISFARSDISNNFDINQAICVYDIDNSNISDNVFVNNKQHVIFLDSHLVYNSIYINSSYIHLIFEISSQYSFINF